MTGPADLQRGEVEMNRAAWSILGGLRFFLAFVVVCGHLGRFVQPNTFTNIILLSIGRLDPVEAVIGFLVISGYSIAHSYSSKPDGYYRRRAFRIYPLYAVGVLLALVPFLFTGPYIPVVEAAVPDAAKLTCNLALMQGFLCVPINSNRPLWTLAVEVACYALAPLFFRMPRRVLVSMILVSAFAYAALPRLGLPFYSRMQYGLPLLFLLWPWLAGFVFYQNRNDIRYMAALLALGLAMIVANHVFNTRYSPVTYAVSVLIIAGCARIRIGDRLASWANYLGELSYPLYIVHTPVLILVYLLITRESALLSAALALATAAAAYHLIDKPIRLRRRPRRATEAGAAAT